MTPAPVAAAPAAGAGVGRAAIDLGETVVDGVTGEVIGYKKDGKVTLHGDIATSSGTFRPDSPWTPTGASVGRPDSARAGRVSRTAEIEHTLTRAWLNANAGSGSINRPAMEVLLRRLRVESYFRVTIDGASLEPYGRGREIQYTTLPDGGVKLTFKWEA